MRKPKWTKKELAALERAMKRMDFRFEQTGGGCTAWVLEHSEDIETLITVVNGCRAPTSLFEPCEMTTFDQGEATVSGIYESVLEALRDVYGRVEGEEWPAYLKGE